MINFNDDVPHLPPRDWGYEHNSGEIWILQDGTTYEACSGQENPVSFSVHFCGKKLTTSGRTARTAWPAVPKSSSSWHRLPTTLMSPSTMDLMPGSCKSKKDPEKAPELTRSCLVHRITGANCVTGS